MGSSTPLPQPCLWIFLFIHIKVSLSPPLSLPFSPLSLPPLHKASQHAGHLVLVLPEMSALAPFPPHTWVIASLGTSADPRFGEEHPCCASIRLAHFVGGGAASDPLCELAFIHRTLLGSAALGQPRVLCFTRCNWRMPCGAASAGSHHERRTFWRTHHGGSVGGCGREVPRVRADDEEPDRAFQARKLGGWFQSTAKLDLPQPKQHPHAVNQPPRSRTSTWT